jgi:hypothetical protein
MRLFRRLPDSAGQARYGNDTLLYKVADGRWHQKFDILDFDEDGDKDVLCGWGRGFTGGKGIWLYRTPNGIAGSLPFAFSEKGKVQNSGLSISTSPNPSAGSAVVRWNRGASAHSSKIDIIDIMGRTIKSIVPSVMNGATKINFSELSGKNGSLQTGIYFIRITTGKHSISIRHLNIR